jgi:putative phosphoesterase
MRAAIFSDIHSNPFALRAVLADIGKHQPDLILCAGDIFGYYPWAQQTFELLRPLCARTVLGNHDRLVLETLGLVSEKPGGQRPSYYEAAQLNGMELSSEAREWLKHLPASLAVEAGSWRIRMAHGTPENLLEGRFYPDDTAQPAWLPAAKEILVLGHTHYPILRRTDGGGWLLNPGSVGQPRDGEPQPSWISLELTDAGGAHAELHRVAYDQFEPMALLTARHWPEKFIRALNKTNSGPLPPTAV